MAKFEVHYSLKGTITIDAVNKEEAREKIINSDYTKVSDLLHGAEINIIMGEDNAIGVDDVYEADDIDGIEG